VPKGTLKLGCHMAP